MAKRKRDQSESSEDEGGEFEINVIDRVRCVQDEDGSTWEYHVRWLGYPNPDDDTWEPHTELEKTVPALLGRLWSEIDPNDENKDYHVGDEIAPSNKWIRKEIKDSEKRWAEIQKEKEDKKARRKDKSEKRRKENEEKRKGKKKQPDDSDDDDDDDDIAFSVRKEEGLHKDSERLRSQRKNKRGAFDHTKSLADDLNEGAKSASDVGEASGGESDAPLASQLAKSSSGPRFVKKKENPYTLGPRAGSSKATSKTAGQKRKVTGGREMTADSEDERPASKLKKKKTLETSSTGTSARASPAGSEPILAKAKGKARAKAVVLSPSPEPMADDSIPVLPSVPSPRPTTPPPASDADDGSLFGSSPQKAPPVPIPTTSAPPRNTTRAPAPETGSAPTSAPATRPAQRRSVQIMDVGYSDGSALGTKAAAIRKNPLAKAGFPHLNLKTGGKTGTPTGSPVIPQGPRSATGTPRIAQQSPVIAQQSPTIPQQSPTGLSMSPPTNFMDVDGPRTASPVNVDFGAQADELWRSLASTSAAPPAPPMQPPRPYGGALKIPKKWKWEGEVFVHHKAKEAAPFARVVISDAMEPLPKSMRLNIVFRTNEGQVPLDSIKFEKLMSRTQILQFFRPASKRPSQFARLSGSGSQDKEVLNGLARYMNVHDLGSYAFMDDAEGHPEALLLLVPSARYGAWKFVHSGQDGKMVPSISEELQQGPFFVAVCQWKASGEKIAAYGMRPTNDALERVHAFRAQIAPPDPARKSEAKTMRAHPGLERARRILNLPQQLLDFLADKDHVRPYGIWSYPSDGVATQQKVGLETTMLRDVIRAANGHEVGLESQAIRVLFVHVGSIQTLAQAPHIIERRKQQVVQIFTYGTHHTVAPMQWGVREIYIMGGAVTFGPGLVKDAYGAARRIAEMANEHPTWTAFITPSVLALAMYEVYGENPLQVFDEHPEQFPHRKLLELIISGRLSILRKPPTRIAIAGEADYDEHKKWIDWHRDIIFDGERGVLEECLHWFNARYEHEFRSNGDDITPHEQKLRRFVLEELRTTVNAVMVQPAMIESARRFVVVLGEGEHAVGSVKCGFEWETLSRFNFGDGFWCEEDMADMRQKLW